ncbi:hypothetical protein CBLAS_0577 [Campylobacter blaseri]|uniref:Uncharacterized protein n=1 Tax=Campylobacter blaseri TaxID=2042961 RepID=A0A2P8R073_9BACT|nr:hypothetical protein [Campylobacter blaseri]PSM51893.1 hypothetical protein CQ405_04830 [Campylobacter blaseri]PSM53677.1 hypothetical protein CRN67_04830 [Campylobacter blaseri]QKF85770.1 hypothetical protein CBLAS_0577 [Campylobacter blaseri]
MIIPIFNANQNLENKFLQAEILKIKNDQLSDIARQINSKANIKNIIMTNHFILKNKEILYNKIENNKSLKTQTPYKEIYTAIYKDKLNKDISNSINFIYMIILGLCLFSLQKTARRNSVVPN